MEYWSTGVLEYWEISTTPVLQYSIPMLTSTDPVALDYVGMTIINQQRQKRNIRLVSKEARHIHTAAQRGLGTDDPQRMDIEKLRFG